MLVSGKLVVWWECSVVRGFKGGDKKIKLDPFKSGSMDLKPTCRIEYDVMSFFSSSLIAARGYQEESSDIQN